MKMRNLVLGIAAGMTLLGAAGAVSAATITSADGVLSIETPSDAWTQKTDSKALLEITDGKNSIAVEHMSNGEALPAQQVADEKNPDVYVSLISTKNEVFSVKGLAVDNQGLQSVIQTAGTIKILKFDTKTAVAPAATAKKADTAQKTDTTKTTEEKKTETTSKPDIVVYDSDGMSVELYFDPATGEYKDANGNAFLTMAGGLVYQPDSNSYWNTDKNFWNEHSEDEFDYSTIAEQKAGSTESFTVFSESGDSRTLKLDVETGDYVDGSGLVYLPMAGSLVYQPDTDSYWSGDASYWDSYSEDEMSYDDFINEVYNDESDTEEGQSDEEDYVEDYDAEEEEYYDDSEDYEDDAANYDYDEEVYE